jgi:uncharacterized membrane protein YeaQ/YmgE (transglycosylase-associated protein family)
MGGHSLIAWVFIGVVAGWLAGLLVRGRGFGLIGDVVLGVIGAFVGRWIAGKLGLHIGPGVFSAIVTATGGAVVLAALARLIRRD